MADIPDKLVIDRVREFCARQIGEVDTCCEECLQCVLDILDGKDPDKVEET